MSGTRHAAANALFRNLVIQGLDSTPIARLMEELSDGLTALGMPLLRVNTGHLTIHPELVGFNHEWWRTQSMSVASSWNHADKDRTSIDDGRNEYPYVYMMEEDLAAMRIRMDDPADRGQYPPFPLFEQFLDLGVTDYYARTIELDESGESGKLSRYYISFCADEDGFTEEDIDLIESVLPAFSLAVKSRTHETVVHNLLDAYLGREAGRRVLDGQIALGDTVNIKSVICFSDLRGSTRWAEELPDDEFVSVLNDYFGAVAGAIYEMGGEVLRYIGDGILSIFPYSETGEDGKCCSSRSDAALSAALVAQERMKLINQDRERLGKGPLEFGMALHVGDVTYGNIGINQRLDFTVIGPAANTAARMEGLCREEGQNLLVSKEFVDGTMPPPGGWKALGPRRLKGVNKPVEVLTLAEPFRMHVPLMQAPMQA